MSHHSFEEDPRYCQCDVADEDESDALHGTINVEDNAIVNNSKIANKNFLLPFAYVFYIMYFLIPCFFLYIYTFCISSFNDVLRSVHRWRYMVGGLVGLGPPTF